MSEDGSQRKPRPTILGVGGGSGSGKTTFCRALLSFVGEGALYVSSDSYYFCNVHRSLSERARVNYDHPDSIDFALLQQHIKLWRQGEIVQVPRYDFATHSREAASESTPAKPLVIVEGILVLTAPELSGLFDYTVFVDAPTEVRFQRRLLRDQKERGRTAESIQEQWELTVEPMYQKFCAPGKSAAGRVISGVSWDESDIQSILARIFHQPSATPG